MIGSSSNPDTIEAVGGCSPVVCGDPEKVALDRGAAAVEHGHAVHAVARADIVVSKRLGRHITANEAVVGSPVDHDAVHAVSKGVGSVAVGVDPEERARNHGVGAIFNKEAVVCVAAGQDAEGREYRHWRDLSLGSSRVVGDALAVGVHGAADCELCALGKGDAIFAAVAELRALHDARDAVLGEQAAEPAVARDDGKVPGNVIWIGANRAKVAHREENAVIVAVMEFTVSDGDLVNVFEKKAVLGRIGHDDTLDDAAGSAAFHCQHIAPTFVVGCENNLL